MPKPGMQAMDQGHERSLAQQQTDAEAMSQASDQAHQMGMTQVQQPQVGECQLMDAFRTFR